MRTSCPPLRTSFLRAGIAAFTLVLGLSACGGGGGGTTSSGGAGAPVPAPAAQPLVPVIATQPLDQAVAIGQSATLTVSAQGAGQLSYEWTRDNVVIPGANGPSYTVPAATAGDNGAVFRVGISNANGAIVSRAVLLTVNGSGAFPFIGDPANYYALSARTTWFASALAFDPAGNLYVTSSGGLRKISALGVVTDVPRPVKDCYSMLSGAAVDKAGNLFLVCASAVYKVAPGAESVLYAGSPSIDGFADGKGAEARFRAPGALAINDQGVVYVADGGNGRLRRIDLDGTVSTVAGGAPGTFGIDGSGAAARFEAMMALALDVQGNLVVADNSTIRKVSPAGVVTTVAGNLQAVGLNDGSAASARFISSRGIAVDQAGNILVSDSFQNTVRKLSVDGQVTTVAGQRGLRGTGDGTGTAAMFTGPDALAFDKQGNLFIGEGAGAIRKMTPAGEVSIFAGTTMLPSSTSTVLARGHEGTFWFVAAMSLTPAGELLYSANDGILKASPQGDVRLFASSNAEVYTYGVSVPGIKLGLNAHWLALAAGHNYTFAIVKPRDYQGNTPSVLRKFDARGAVTPLDIPAADGALGPPSFKGIAVDADDVAYVSVEQRVLVCTGPAVCAEEPRAFVYRIALDGSAVLLAAGPGAYPGSAGTSFSVAGGIAVDRNKNVYVADLGNRTVLKITPSGTVSTLAGSPGTTGQADGVGSAARFAGPDALAVDLNGNVYVSDRGNYTIRKITPAGAVSTIAGVPGRMSYQFNPADGSMSIVNALAVDASGTVYAAFDYGILKFVP